MSQGFRVYEQAFPYFITSTVTYWIPIFCRDDYFRILADSLTYCTKNKGLLVHAYVLMPNHFHLGCSHSEGKLSGVIGDIKKFTSKEIAKKLKEDGRNIWLKAFTKGDEVSVWDDGFHPEHIHSKPFLLQKIDYIHNNPVRAGYVEDVCDWKYSSAGFYYKERESIIPLTPLEP